MSTILGNPITLGGGGGKLNIDFGTTPPSDTSKLWVPLAKKPSAVECSPALAFGSEYLTNMAYVSGTSIPIRTCILGNKIYGFVQPRSSTEMSNFGIYYYTWDIATGERKRIKWESSGVVYAQQQNYKVKFCFGGSPVVHGNSIYLVGGYVQTREYYSGDSAYVFKFTPSENKIERLAQLSTFIQEASSGNKFLEWCGCCEVNGVIYAFGGTYHSFDISSNTYASVMAYDISTNSCTTIGMMVEGDYLSTGTTWAYTSQTCFPIGNTIYLFGGYGRKRVNKQYDNYTERTSILKYDIETKTTTEIGQLPHAARFLSVVKNGTSAYIVGCNNTDMYKFNSADESLTKLSDTLSSVSNSFYSGEKLNDKIYICAVSSSDFIYAAYLTISSPLTSNHLFLQEDSGYDGLWTALKSKDTDFKIKVINAYLGDSNNIAQLTDAYLYDSDSATWKSLDGVSMTADMLEALATLGVT